MIKLNLASSPGIKKNQVPILKLKKREEILTSDVENKTKNDAELSLDILKGAENQVDDIEQEFVPKNTSFAPYEEDFQKRFFKRSFIYYVSLLVIIVALGFAGYWGYLTFFSSSQKADITQKINESKKIIDDKIEDTKDVLGDNVKKVQDVVQEKIPTDIIPVKQYEVSDQHILNILSGKEILENGMKVCENLPPRAHLNYLQINNNKVSFVLYVATKEEGLQFKNNILGQLSSVTPMVFYIDREAGVPGKPYQVMAVLKNKGVAAGSKHGYGFFDDNQLARLVGEAGYKADLALQPLKIFSRDNRVPRKSQIFGQGNSGHISRFFNSLLQQKTNLGIVKLDFSNPSNGEVLTSPLKFQIESIIYPRKP